MSLYPATQPTPYLPPREPQYFFLTLTVNTIAIPFPRSPFFLHSCNDHTCLSYFISLSLLLSLPLSLFFSPLSFHPHRLSVLNDHPYSCRRQYTPCRCVQNPNHRLKRIRTDKGLGAEVVSSSSCLDLKILFLSLHGFGSQRYDYSSKGMQTVFRPFRF